MPSSDSRDFATGSVLVGLLFLGGGLLALMAMVAPHILGIFLVIAVLVGFGSLHYLIWGWWLRPLIHEREKFLEQEAKQNKQAE